jgi:hypothetical protein
MRTLTTIVALMAASWLTGCYENPLTIGPSRVIDERLIGTWRYADKNHTYEYTFMRRGGGDYFVQMLQDGKDPHYARAYFSTIQGVDILNGQDIGTVPFFEKGKYSSDSHLKYMFFTYQLTSPDKLTLSGIRLHSKQNASPFVLRQEIGMHLTAGDLKVNPQRFTRLK